MTASNESTETLTNVSTDKKQKTSGFAGFLQSALQVATLGERKDDKVIRWFKDQICRLKYAILLFAMIDVFAIVAVGFPCYAYYKIKRGEVDDLAEKAVKFMDVAMSEQAETEETPEMAELKANETCTNCGSTNTDFLGSDGNYSEWYCNDCKINFSLEE